MDSSQVILPPFHRLSAAAHFSAERALRQGVPPHLVFQEQLGRPPSAGEIATLALAPSTARTMTALEDKLVEIGRNHMLEPLHPTVIMDHITNLIAKGWKFSSTLTCLRNILMLASRRGK